MISSMSAVTCSQRYQNIPEYPSLPKLNKLANSGKALNFLEFSIFTNNGLGTSSGMISVLDRSCFDALEVPDAR